MSNISNSNLFRKNIDNTSIEDIIEGYTHGTVNTGKITADDGTAALPLYSFESDLDTGAYLSAADTLAFSTGGVERLAISSAGIVPTVNLSVPDSFGIFTSNQNTGIQARVNDLALYGKNKDLYTIFGTPLTTSITSTERNHLFNGRVGCTELAAGNVPIDSNQYHFHVESAGSTMSLYRKDTNAGGGVFSVRSDVNVVEQVKLIIFEDGDILNLTGIYGTLSDRRTKKNIVKNTDASNGNELNKLNQLKTYEYEKLDDSGKKMRGCMADELELIYPDLVTDASEMKGKDKNGAELEDLRAINYYGLIVPLLCAVQKLTERIEALEAKI